MTVSHRKTKVAAKPDDRTAAEPGVQYHCDVCEADITLTVRIRCAGGCKEFDLCCSCFCAGAETKQHKAHHAYRIVEQHAYPIFASDWGADEELLLIDGCQLYGLGNWADIADHIGNRSKEEVEAHYIQVFVEGRDGTSAGDKRAREADEADEADVTRTSRQLPVRGPNMDYVATITADAFHQAKRQRISDLRSRQAALPIGSQKNAPPKPLVSAPTSHHELSGFMAGRLEFETEHEQEAEVLVKDMEFGKVYRFGGELLPSEEQALGGKAVAGRSRMEASGRGGTSSRAAGAKGTTEKSGEDSQNKDEEGDETQKDDKDEEDDEDGAAEDGEDKDKDGDEDTKPDADDDASTTAANDEAAAADAALPSSSAVEKDEQPAEASERPPADWDEDPRDCDLKLAILQMYNERLERRAERKRAILERGLVEVRRRQAEEKRRPKEDRDLLARIRHFAPCLTPMDFEVFLDGLCYQDQLARLGLQLQEYRAGGIRVAKEIPHYEHLKLERQQQRQQMLEDEYGGPLPAALAGGTSTLSAAKRGPGNVKRAAGRDSETPFGDEDVVITSSSKSAASSKASGGGASTGGGSITTNGKPSSNTAKDKDGKPKVPRKPPRPLDLSSSPGFQLLTRPEKMLCSVQRLQPTDFLDMKKKILSEYIHQMNQQKREGKNPDGLSRRGARTLFKMDVNKLGKLYDFLEEQGYIRAARNLGWFGGEDGVGPPPGWKDDGSYPDLDVTVVVNGKPPHTSGTGSLPLPPVVT